MVFWGTSSHTFADAVCGSLTWLSWLFHILWGDSQEFWQLCYSHHFLRSHSLTPTFQQSTLFFKEVSDLQKYCKESTELPYIMHTGFSIIHIVHLYGTFIIIMKSVSIYHYSLKSIFYSDFLSFCLASFSCSRIASRILYDLQSSRLLRLPLAVTLSQTSLVFEESWSGIL